MFPSSTERALGALLAAALAAACGDDAECGPGDAPAEGVTVAAGGGVAAFGLFESSPNNDCTPTGGTGPVSLNVLGPQTEPAGGAGFVNLCLPRPDEVGGDPISMEDADRVQLTDLRATDSNGCEIELDRDGELAGEITFSGFCDDGAHEGGYALSFAATVPVVRTCAGGEPEPIDAELAGRVSVTARNQTAPP